jgi:hypothetical protein
MTILWPLIGILAAGLAAPARAGGFVEVTTQEELDAALEKTPEIRKNFDRFKEGLKRLERRRRERPDVDERSLEGGMIDPEIQEKNAQRVANAKPDIQDLVEEYLVEKHQAAEEAFWVVAEEKGTPETRPMYRNYLRMVYFHGTAKDANASTGISQLRAWLDADEGWRNFPTLNTGEVPPGAAGVYYGGRRHISLIDPGGIVVFSHEMWHFWDDVFGGVDGSISFMTGGVEPLAYGLMGSELGGSGGAKDEKEEEEGSAESFDLVCSLR